jgi:hypothetical protein
MTFVSEKSRTSIRNAASVNRPFSIGTRKWSMLRSISKMRGARCQVGGIQTTMATNLSDQRDILKMEIHPPKIYNLLALMLQGLPWLYLDLFV